MKKLLLSLVFVLLISTIGFAAPQDPVIVAPLAFNDFPAGNIVVDGTCNSGNTDDIAISGDAPASTVPCTTNAWTYTWVLPADTETVNYDLTFTATKDAVNSAPVTNTFDVDTKDPVITISSPTEGATVNAPVQFVTISGTIADSNMALVGPTINDNRFTISNFDSVLKTFTFRNNTNVDGAVAVIVSYTDDLTNTGQSGVRSFTVSLAQQSKTLTVTSSAPTPAAGAAFTVTGVAKVDTIATDLAVVPTVTETGVLNWCGAATKTTTGTYTVSCTVPAATAGGTSNTITLNGTLEGDAVTGFVTVTTPAPTTGFELVNPNILNTNVNKDISYTFKVKFKDAGTEKTDLNVTISGSAGCTGTMAYTGGSYQKACTLSTVGNKTIIFSTTYNSQYYSKTIYFNVNGTTNGTIDTLKVLFTFPSSNAIIEPGKVVLFMVDVTDNLGYGITNATVKLKTPGGEFPMEDLGNKQYKYSYTLPADFTSYTFEVTATKGSDSGKATKLLSMADQTYTVTLTAPQTIYKIGDKFKFKAVVKSGTIALAEATITAKVNGNAITFTEDTNNTGTYYSEEYEVVPEDGKTKKLKLEVTAAKGVGSGTAKLEVSLEVKDLQTNLEQNMTISGDVIKFTVTDKDGNPINDGNFTVTFEGVTYTAEHVVGNTYQVTVDIEGLNKTEYTMTISGYDAAGNSLQETLTVQYQEGGFNWLILLLIVIAAGCIGVFYFLFTKLPPSIAEAAGEELGKIEKKRRELIDLDKSAHYQFYKRMIDEPTLKGRVDQYQRQIRGLDEKIKKLREQKK